MPNTYRKATNYICDVVEEVIVDGKLNFPESSFADSVFSYSEHISIRYMEFGNVLHPLSGRLPTYEIKPGIEFYLIELAAMDREFFDYLVQICWTNILAELPPKYPLSLFVSNVLSGKMVRPKKAARPRKRDWMEKNYLWSLTLELVQDYGLTLTRNDGTAANASACDAMAEALTVCGRKTNYTEIKNLMVHPDYARRRKEFEVTRKLYFRKRDEGAPNNALHPEYFKHWYEAAREDVMDIMGTFPLVTEKT